MYKHILIIPVPRWCLIGRSSQHKRRSLWHTVLFGTTACSASDTIWRICRFIIHVWMVYYIFRLICRNGRFQDRDSSSSRSFSGWLGITVLFGYKPNCMALTHHLIWRWLRRKVLWILQSPCGINQVAIKLFRSNEGIAVLWLFGWSLDVNFLEVNSDDSMKGSVGSCST